MATSPNNSQSGAQRSDGAGDGAPVLDYRGPTPKSAPSVPDIGPPETSRVERVAMLVGVVTVGAMLYFAKPILLPLALALLLSFLLSPLCEWLERRRVPRVASVVAVVVLAFLVLGGVGAAVYNGLVRLGADMDQIHDRLVAKAEQLPFRGGGGTVEKVQRTIEDVGRELGEGTEKAAEELSGEDEESSAETTQSSAGVPPADPQALRMDLENLRQTLQTLPDQLAEAQRRNREQALTRQEAVPGTEPDSPIYVQDVPREQSALERAGYVLVLAAGPLGMAGLVVIFALFILLARDDLRDRVIKLTAGSRLNLATQALDDAASRISRYLAAQCIVNGSYGIAIGIGLTAISYFMAGRFFPSVFLWALLCFALRFIPYLGPWVAAAFPMIVSLGYYDGYGVFLAVAAMFVVIELLSNNVMEPMLYGSSTGMSAVAVIIAAVFWTFVWGPVGLLVATPLTTCLVVLGKYVPALRFFDILLGDEPVLSPRSRLYQRLLAMDADDAEDVVDEFREEHTLTETYDSLLLPALAMAERDRHAGTLTAERADFICNAMRDIVEHLGRQKAPIPSDSVDLEQELPEGSPVRQTSVVVLPSADSADETAAMMLKQLLDRRGFRVTVVDEEELAAEKLEQVFSHHADVVVISAVPPRAVAQARYLIKRLQQAQFNRGEEAAGTAASTIVGLWTVRSDTERAAARIGSQQTKVRVVRTLGEAEEAVRQRAEVAAARRNTQTAAPQPAGV